MCAKTPGKCGAAGAYGAGALRDAKRYASGIRFLEVCTSSVEYIVQGDL